MLNHMLVFLTTAKSMEALGSYFPNNYLVLRNGRNTEEQFRTNLRRSLNS